jgi:hypothetical protein
MRSEDIFPGGCKGNISQSRKEFQGFALETNNVKVQ